MNEKFEEVLGVLKEKLEVYAKERKEFVVSLEDDVMSMQRTITASELQIYYNELCVCNDIWVSYPESGLFMYDDSNDHFILTQGAFKMYIDFNENDEY